MEDFDMEASLGYARVVVTKTYDLWEAADPDQKRRLQKLIFPEDVSFDGKTLGTPLTALIFSVLGQESANLEGLVGQTFTSSNSLAPIGHEDWLGKLASLQEVLRIAA